MSLPCCLCIQLLNQLIELYEIWYERFKVLFSVHLFVILMTNSNECTLVSLYYTYRAPTCFSLYWPSSGSRSYYTNIKLFCYNVVSICPGLITVKIVIESSIKTVKK